MTPEQRAAEQREKAEMAAEWVRHQGDVLHDANQALSYARRAFDSIVFQENNSTEVVRDLMEHIADATSVLDDMLVELWEIMEPDSTKEEREIDRAYVEMASEEAVEKRAKVMFERYAARIEGNNMQWDDLTMALRQSWLRMAARTEEGV